PWAHLAIMDEGLEKQDALVKVEHPIMNERKHINGTVTMDVPLISMFAATNVSIEEAVDGKAAYIDRYHLRFKVGYPDDEEMIKEIRRVTRARRKGLEQGTTVTLKELAAAQKEAMDVEISEEVDNAVGKIYKQCLGRGIIVSPRRLAQLDPVVQAKAWLRGRTKADPSDLRVFEHALWTNECDIEPLQNIIDKEAKSQVNQALELLQDVEGMKTKWQGVAHGDAKRATIAADVKKHVQQL
ncbi:unnamed protein product, partial [marine sediment metagenome]